MIMALVDSVLDDYCNFETVLIVLFTVIFAVCIEIFSAPHIYLREK